MLRNQTSTESITQTRLANLRNQLLLRLRMTDGKVALLTSPHALRDENQLAIQLAGSFAAHGTRTLLISLTPEVDERLTQDAAIDAARHLGNLVAGTDSAADDTSYIQATTTGIEIVLGGLLADAPADFVNTSRFNAWLEAIRPNYDVILIAGGSLLGAPDTLLVAALADIVGLAVSYRTTKKRDVDRSLMLLRRNAITDVFGVYLDVPADRGQYDF